MSANKPRAPFRASQACRALRALGVAVLLNVSATGNSIAFDATFAGKIGKSEIVACLENDLTGGSYYYARIGKTLDLDRSEARPETLLENQAGTSGGPYEDSSPRWRIRAAPDGTVEGEWLPGSEAKQKRLPIALSRVSEGCEEYERRRMDLPAVPVAAKHGKHPMIAYYRHPLADVSGLRVRLPKKPSVERAINEELAARFREYVVSSFACRDYSISIEAKKLYPQLIIVDINGEEYCGGAHTNEESITLPFDLNTGQPVTWTLGDKSTPQRQGAGKNEKNLRQLLDKELDKAYGKDREDREECKTYSWIRSGTPEADGVRLAVWADARSALMCRDSFVIPYSKIRPYIVEAELPGFDLWAKRMKNASAYEFGND